MTTFGRFLFSPMVLLTYTIVLAAVALALVQARGCVVQQYGTAKAQADWQDWRNVAKRQSTCTGPVQRHPRKSPQPPALVLMREHFLTCTVFSLTMVSALFVTLAYAVRGVMSSPKMGNQTKPEQA